MPSLRLRAGGKTFALEAGVVDFNAALIKKIVRMLESEHDGERAVAAGKLHSMAKDRGKNVDEMLAAVYGGGARQPQSVYEQPRQRQSSWGNEWGGTNFRDPPSANSFAETVRRASEAAKKRHAEREAEAQRRRGPADSSLLDQLQAQVNAWGTRMLTTWEHDFIANIFDWCGNLTLAQKATIERILEKYAAYAKRNGEAESFWKA